MKYSFLKIEDPPPLEDGTLSDGPDSLCIYKSKYAATYREKAPILWWKSRFNQKCICAWKKTFDFQKQLDLLNVGGYCYLPGFLILPVRKHLTACLLFGHDFPTKASRDKNLFSQSFRPSAVSYFSAHCEGKKKKTDPSHESV